MIYLDPEVIGCHRSPRPPRCYDRQKFYTLCGKLGYRVSTVPREVAGFIRREIRRAASEARKPSAKQISQRLLNSRRWA